MVNAFTADGIDTGMPDLVGITGDTANGFGLAYDPNFWAPGLYLYGTALDNPTPAGDHDWQAWNLVSTETEAGLALFLRHATTGDLYLWTGVILADHGDGTGSLAHTQHRVAANIDTGALQAADINTDGTPDLWTVRPDGTYRAYLISAPGPDGTARVTTTRARPLVRS